MRIKIWLSLAFFVALTASLCFADEVKHLLYEVSHVAVPIRVAPDVNAQKITEIPKGATVQVSDQKGDWVKVIYWLPNRDGCIFGWAQTRMMSPLDIKGKRNLRLDKP